MSKKLNAETFRGLTVQSVAPVFPRDSKKWAQLTWAIDAWRKAALGTGQNMHLCNNAARELEIERDHGFIVHLNRRTA